MPANVRLVICKWQLAGTQIAERVQAVFGKCIILNENKLTVGGNVYVDGRVKSKNA